MVMKFLIVGVGAIGSAYLAFLTRAGHEAAGLVRRNPVNRIKVEGIWGEFEIPVKTFTKVEEVPFIPDIVIISVKSYDTEEALKKVKPVVGENTFIMIAQNGYGNYEKAVEIYGEGKVILSRIIFGSKVIKPGHIRITVSADEVVIGDPSGKIDEEFLKNLARTFTEAGIPTRYERDVYKYLVDKIIYNSALNPLGALFEVNYGSLAENPHTKELMNRVIDEIFQVIEKAKLPCFWKSADEYKKVFYEKLIPPTAEHYPSMLEDVKKGKTEIEALNGAIVELGKKYGVSTPTNEFITKMVKAKELFNLKDT
ncbi:2-dehydropantoate 2-reductase [Aquifex aeolicus]|uniref:2-dehydropantoate 2-reductase n=1 Tax=Aquifex aeolicus (strain VF5) TaxID=224324 RepID=PANE_AQUAE|nr:2-dehydropantoate 2-reductase [Aquifex aeolicus]O67619.1 RecName: Full=2-dehydropantoate 2-reductase; AltName: Full=Ketopantoate reductase; Short=KPR [Aquifex aeolicus VF5]AAC07585.1 putative protein [Aquifex aeolicus VF5]